MRQNVIHSWTAEGAKQHATDLDNVVLSGAEAGGCIAKVIGKDQTDGPAVDNTGSSGDVHAGDARAKVQICEPHVSGAGAPCVLNAFSGGMHGP